MRYSRAWGSGVVAVVAAAVLVGCGSSGGDAQGTPSTATSASTQATTSGKTDPTYVCKLLTAAEVSAAIGGTATLEPGPTGDCEFKQESDLRAPSGSVGFLPHADTNGGYAAYVSAMPSTLDKPAKHEISGIGSAAVAYIGPSIGGAGNLQATAAADLGENRVVTVVVAQGNGMSEAEVLAVVTKLLTLMANKAG